MEFEIDQARFLSALSLAQTVADKRSTMPVLANVLLRAEENGRVVCSATDMLISLTEFVPAQVKSTGSLTVGARHLHGLVRTLPEGPVRIKALDNHWAEIVSGKAQFKLMGIPEADFPELPDPRRGKKAPAFVSLPVDTLSSLIAKTAFSISADEARVNLNGVLFESDGSMGTMVSTDGHRLTKFVLPLDGLTLDKSIVIPRKGVLEIKRVLDRVHGQIGVAVGDQHLFVQTEDLLLSVKLNQVTFPPYKAVIPTAHQRVARVRRDELVGALRRAEVMAPEKTATVRLRLTTGELELKADNPDLGVAHQELAIDYEGEELTAGFNARYLLEAVDAIDTDEIRLEFQGALDPCVVKPVDGPDFLGVVMPMHI